MQLTQQGILLSLVNQTVLPELIQQRRIVGSVGSGVAAPFIALTSAPAQGNLIIIIAFAVQQRTVTTPGFTLLNGYNDADGTTYIFWKIADGSEPTPPAGYQVTYSTGGTNYSLHIYEFDNVNSDNPVEYLGGNNGTGANHTVDASSADVVTGKNEVFVATINGDNSFSAVAFDNSFINELPASGSTYSSSSTRSYSSITPAQNTAITITGTASTNTHLFKVRGRVGVFIEVSAGPDQSIDSGDTVQLAGNRDGLWTTSGTGTFDDDTISNAVYTPSTADITLGFITLTLTSGGFSDSMSVTIGVSDILSLVSHYWDADDATDTAGNLTAWVDRKASAGVTLIGTPTVTSAAIDGHKTVDLNGTSSALAMARIAFKSVKIVMKYAVSGSRIIHVPSSNASTNFHAGIFIITGSNTLTVGMSGDNHRDDYYLTDAEKDADLADNVFYNYSFRNLIDFRRNMKKGYPIHETTTTDTSSTATNMFIGCRRRGDNASTVDQFAKANIAAIFLATTEWTQDQSIAIDRYINARWPTVAPEDTQYIVPLTATRYAGAPLDSGHTDGGGAGNYYPPAVIKTTEFYIMAKAANNTGCMIRSNDSGVGESWIEVATAKITDTSVTLFNGTYAYRDGSIFSDGTTAYCWFVARNNDTVDIEQIGLATASVASITGAWANAGLKLSLATVNTALSTSYTGLGSPKCRKVDDQYYLFVSAYDATGGDIIVCTMTAINGGTITPIQKVLERDLPYHTIYSSSIIYHLGRFIMITHNGWFETTRGERNLVIYATDEGGLITGPYSLKSIAPLLEPRYATSGAFDEGGVYDPEVVVENDGTGLTPYIDGDGNMWIFFAGVSWPVEVGLMGYCKVPQALFEIATF